MKTNFLLFTLILLTINIKAQENLSDTTIEITYVKAFKNYKDTTDIKPREIEDLKYKFLSNNIESRFELIQTFGNITEMPQERFKSLGGGGRGIYYKNLKEKKNIISVKDKGQNFLINDSWDKFKWELFDDTKEILGYKCFKAVGSYVEYNYALEKNQTITVIAWYAPSIPFPFGPSGFDGLPGLVLESVRGSFYLTATEIKFHKLPEKIERPQVGIEISDEDFAKKQYNDFLNQMLQQF